MGVMAGEITPESLPRVHLPAAEGAAERLRRAARLADQASAELDAAVPPSWWGGASEEYFADRAELSRRLVDVVGLCSQFASAVDRYTDEVGPCLAALRRAAERLQQARRRTAAGGPVPGVPVGVDAVFAVRRDQADAEREFDAAVVRYRAVVATLSTAAKATVDGVQRQPRTLTEHVDAGAHQVWQLGVAEPAAAAWALTGGLVKDPAGWWQMVKAIPGGIRDQLAHPRRTADELVGGPQFRGGEWGQGVGTLVSAFIGARHLKEIVDAETLKKFARNIADPRAPRPRVQTVDEMLDRVDLARSEHYSLGHTIRRHIDVTHEYLRDRLDHGTLGDRKRRETGPLKNASQWKDLETAEAAITRALRENEADLRSLAAGNGKATRTFKFTAESDQGLVMFDGPSGERLVPSARVFVLVKRKGSEIYVDSAYLERP